MTKFNMILRATPVSFHQLMVHIVGMGQMSMIILQVIHLSTVMMSLMAYRRDENIVWWFCFVYLDESRRNIFQPNILHLIFSQCFNKSINICSMPVDTIENKVGEEEQWITVILFLKKNIENWSYRNGCWK